MSHNISRKPVPSAAPAVTATPPAAHTSDPRGDIYEDDLSKDIEKSAYSASRTRVSTEIDEPLAPYHGSTYKRGTTSFGDSLFVEKVKSFRFKKFGAGSGATAQGQSTGGQKKYFGVRRRTFWICVVVLIIAILALAIGLGVGVSKKKKWVETFPKITPLQHIV